MYLLLHSYSFCSNPNTKRYKIEKPRFRGFFGARNETRTRDPNLGKVVLYQLSYSRLYNRLIININSYLTWCKSTNNMHSCQGIIKFFLKKGSPISRVLYHCWSLSLICDEVHTSPVSIYPPGMQCIRAGNPSIQVYLIFQPVRFVGQCITTLSVGSYPAFSPLPCEQGGLFSVTLSVARLLQVSPLPVRKYGTLCCPDFPTQINGSIERTACFKVTIKNSLKALENNCGHYLCANESGK